MTDKHYKFSENDTTGTSLSVEDTINRLLISRPIPKLNKCYDDYGIIGDVHKDIYTPAVNIINKAIETKTQICVSYDYDCDGITAGAVLITILKHIGADVVYCVPSRLEHGYGLNYDVVTAVTERPCLVVTVDNGISSIDAVNRLNSSGYKVLITDHHMREGDIPDAEYILNPKIYLNEDDDEYMASGCYVAAKLGMQLLKAKYGKNNYNQHDDLYKLWQYAICLTGMSLVSDVIPMNATMRGQLAIALSELTLIDHAGLKALISVSGIKQHTPISERHIGFYIAPKINSAGRIGNTNAALQLLMTDRAESASSVLAAASELKSLNALRKTIELTIFEEAQHQAESLSKLYTHSLVVYNQDWHAGVLGIVAARLYEKFGCPVIVLGKNKDGTLAGSGRSGDRCNLFNTISSCEKLLVRFGGHKSACGISLTENNLRDFRLKFDEACSKETEEDISYEADATVSAYVLRSTIFQHFLMKYAPYGNGYNELVFELKNLEVVNVEYVGEKLTIVALQCIDDTEEAIALTKFRAPEAWGKLLHAKIHAMVTPINNYSTGYTTVEYQLIDVEVVKEENSYD